MSPNQVVGKRRSVALAVCAVVVGVMSTIEVVTDFALNSNRFAPDLVFDHASARGFLHGHDAYEPSEESIPREIPQYRGRVNPGYPQWHLPLRILLAVPFAPLTFTQAAVIWMLLVAAAIVFALYLFARTLDWSRPLAIALSFGVLALPVLRLEIRYAQTEGLILLVLVVAWRSRESTRGLLIGVATALKLFPGFFLLPILGARRFRTAFVAIGVTVVGVIVPWLILGGSSRFFDAIGGWGTIRSWTWNTSVYQSLDNVPVIPYALSVVLAAIAVVRPQASSRDEFWVAAPLMILAWPVSWSFYLVLVIPWLTLAIQRTQGIRRVEYIVIAGIAAAHLPALDQSTPVLLVTPLALAAGVALEFLPMVKARSARLPRQQVPVAQ